MCSFLFERLILRNINPIINGYGNPFKSNHKHLYEELVGDCYDGSLLRYAIFLLAYAGSFFMENDEHRGFENQKDFS